MHSYFGNLWVSICTWFHKIYESKHNPTQPYRSLMLSYHSLQLRPLFQRKLWKQMRKKRVYDKRVKLYILNQDWLKIRKQKDRRRRRVLLKIWKAKRIAILQRRYADVIWLTVKELVHRFSVPLSVVLFDTFIWNLVTLGKWYTR